MAVIDAKLKEIILAITDAIWDRWDMDTTEQGTIVWALNEVFTEAKKHVVQLSGRFLLDPNEINWVWERWWTQGSFARDYGNSESTTIDRRAGWVSFPFDVRLNRFHAWHSNSNGAAEAWGWMIGTLTKTWGSNTVTPVILKNEVTDNGSVWPRNYNNTQNQETDIDMSWGPIIPAWTLIILWVDAPTANATNYYVNMHSGYFEFEKV